MQTAPCLAAGSLLLDHCPRCGGIWFEAGEVQLLRVHRPAALWENLPRRNEVSRAQCHACHACIERTAPRCASCGQQTRFDCPACQQQMEQARYGELTLDVCRRCKGVWFDHHELASLRDIEWKKALKQRRKRLAGAPAEAADGSLVLLDALTFAPDIVFYGAHAAGPMAGSSVEALAHVPGALGDAAGAAGEAASSVFEMLVEIVAGIFSGF